jgi:hypothetical protein
MSILNLSEYTPEPSEGLEAVRHLQKLVAFQQFAMEKVNDAFAKAANMGPLTNEGVYRPSVIFSDPTLVEEVLLPALEEKLRIIRHIDQLQRAFDAPATEPFREAYISLNTAIDYMEERARWQIEGFQEFIQGRDNVDTTQLDNAETETMDIALLNLNMCIQDIGVDADGFLDILHDAFNAVREDVGLSPMSNSTFRDLYIGGLEGEPARFFAQ